MPIPEITGPMIATLVICFAALLLFIWNRLPFEIVGLLILVALALSGLLSPEQAIGGFANDATVTVAAVLFLSAGLERTGVVDLLGRAISQLGRGSELRMQSVLVTSTTFASALLNNTAVVAMLIPLVRRLGREKGIPPSRLLMPLSFASQMGGTLTLIGTSTNLLVAGLLVERGLPRLGLFSFTGAALPLTFAGIAYLLTLGRLLLPARGGAGEKLEIAPFREFQSVLLVMEGSPLIGASADDLQLPGAGKEALRIVGVRRGRREVRQDAALREGDVLLVEGPSEAMARASRMPGLCIPGTWREQAEGEEDEAGGYVLMEAVVPPRSRLIGRDPRRVGSLEWNHVVVLAQQRWNEPVERPGATMDAGDLLLLEGTRAALHRMQREGWLLLTGAVDVRPMRRGKGLLAAGIFAAVLVVAALDWVPIVISSIAGSIAMVVTRCITPGEGFERMDWGVLILLGSIIPLGLAMQESGTATLLASLVLALTEDAGPIAALAALYLLTSLLTEFISNNAAAVLLVPVGIAIAGSLGVSPMPFAIAVMFAASNSFMTPVGYQTNTFVFGPGRYRFTDYTKVGAPLSLLFLLLAVFVIPRFFPF